MKNIVQFWFAVALYLGPAALAAQAQSPTLDPSFILTSAVRNQGSGGAGIGDMVRQPDGKLVVAGDFGSINGRPAFGVARLLPDGQVDTTFAAPPADGNVYSLALQADGKLLVGGHFTTVGGQSRIGIARLLSDGSLDPSFLSPLGRSPSFGSYVYSDVEKIVLQPGRGILVLGGMMPINPTPGSMFFAARLLEATGALDPTFQPGFNTYYCNDVLVQPNGHLVFAGSPRLFNGQQCYVWGALPDGALDPAFVPLPGPNSYSRAHELTRDPATGKLYVVVNNPSGSLSREPVRLLPNGVLDPTFSIVGVFPRSFGGARYVAVQPNGRLLLGGGFYAANGGFFGSVRLLPGGALDPSYDPSRGPRAYVSKVLVQPDGALLFCGSFQEVVGLPVSGLARMLDPNVLSARAAGQADELVAWPVPAREVLHLRLPAGRLARQAALLDALGRVVRCQALAAGPPAPALPTAGLPPGGYLLRVTFASGPPAYRRVVVE